MGSSATAAAVAAGGLVTTATTIIFITDTFIQLTGLFKQVLAGGEAMKLIPNL